MGQIPEGRKPLTWKDMTPKHSSWEAECAALRARVAKLEAALRDISEGRFSLSNAPDYVTDPTPSPQQIARVALGDGQ